ncbi:MAG: hypothetical protein HZA22_04705 [Nitrospirae bacterium]|nr:hypothetical protein [Nitrospirota bacterium]
MAVRIIVVSLLFVAAALSLAQADEIRLLTFDAPGGAVEYLTAHQELAATNYVSGPGGSMVWVSGPGEPPASAGMAVLGASYTEVFADTEKRAVYESVYPPGHYDPGGNFVEVPGEEREFGSFAGRGQEMGL